MKSIEPMQWGGLEFLSFMHSMINREDWREEIDVSHVSNLLRDVTGVKSADFLEAQTNKSFRVLAWYLLVRMQACGIVKLRYNATPKNRKAGWKGGSVWRLETEAVVRGIFAQGKMQLESAGGW